MTNTKEISNTFNQVLVSDELKEVSIEMVEYGLDKIIKDGLLKDIPTINTLVGLINTWNNISSMLLQKKVLAFLFKLRDIPVQKRKKLIRRMDQSQSYRIKISEKLLYIIDHCEDYEKAELVAILFRSLLNEIISRSEFERCVKCVNDMTIDDLREFVNTKKDTIYFDEVKEGNSVYIDGLFQTTIEVGDSINESFISNGLYQVFNIPIVLHRKSGH